MTKLPQLIKESIAIDDDLLQFVEDLEKYTEEEQHKQIELFYNQQTVATTNIAAKVNSWCWAILHLESEAEFYRVQAKRFSQLARTTENKANSMRSFISLTIQANGGKLPTEHFPKLRVQKTRASLVIDDNYTGEIAEDLFKQIPLSEMLDKDKVRTMINQGVKLDFASLAPQGNALYGLK